MVQGIPFSSEDEGYDFPTLARRYVQRYMERQKISSVPQSSFGDIYVVMFSYIGKNWKALVSTSIPDGRYYEVTYIEQQGAVYVDHYVKVDQEIVQIQGSQEKHDENTLHHVMAALVRSGLTEVQAQDAVTSMQNHKILFREQV